MTAYASDRFTTLPDDETLDATVVAPAPAPARETDEVIVGPPEDWTEVLTHLALDHGFGTFVLMGDPDPATLRTFIDDVAPQVRQRVAAARERRLTPSRA